jgi:formate dehydrogenase beta subunit
VPGYLEDIRLGRETEGLALVRENCPMPGTIGRVCVRPCEANCRRGLLDEPLAIRTLKRYLADREIASGKPAEPTSAPQKAQKVAVLGAGPAGLSCAYYLGRLGYKATIFEAQEGPGGMAAYGIPAYRLPRDVLAYEVARVEAQGAEIRYGVKIGEDLTMEQLGEQGFEAVFVGVGAPESSKMRCEGEDAGYQCFMTGITFLGQVSRGQRPIEGEKLVVVGGGNVAMDCVRSALRISFTDVNLLYRRTEAEMPADPQEIVEAKEEGVKFHYLVAPVAVMSSGGKVTGLQCQRMELGEPDDSGRRRPVPVEGSEFVIDCDAIIPAVGQLCVVDCVLPEIEDGITRWNTMVVDPMTFQSPTPKIFGGGDCVTGPATLIAALNAGKKAAASIAQYLEKGSCQPSMADELEKYIDQRGVFDPAEEFSFAGDTHRQEPEVVDPEKRTHGFEEVEGGFLPHQARKEAERCLRCYRIALAAL